MMVFEDGLTSEEAKKRLGKYGLNEIKKKKRVSDWQLVVEQIKSPLMYALLIAMGITGGSWNWFVLTSSILVFIIIVNRVMY